MDGTGTGAMSQTSQVNTGGDAAVQEHSVGELVKQLTEQVATLVRDELKLAQVEMTRKGKQAGLGAGLLGGGGLIAPTGGAALLAIAGVAALMGKGRIQQATPPVPTEAAASVKADVEEIKERARR